MRAVAGIALRRGAPLGARGYVRASAPSLYVRVGTDTDRSPESSCGAAVLTSAADRERRAQARNAIATGQMPGVPPRELQARVRSTAPSAARVLALSRSRPRVEPRGRVSLSHSALPGELTLSRHATPLLRSISLASTGPPLLAPPGAPQVGEVEGLAAVLGRRCR